MVAVYSDMALRILNQYWDGDATEDEFHYVLKPAACRLFRLALDHIRAKYNIT